MLEGVPSVQSGLIEPGHSRFSVGYIRRSVGGVDRLFNLI